MFKAERVVRASSTLPTAERVRAVMAAVNIFFQIYFYWNE